MAAKGSRSTSRSAKTVTGGPNVRKGGGKGSKTSLAQATSSPLGFVRMGVENVSVTGQVVEFDATDRDEARELEEVIIGASVVSIATDSGKAATLTGALLTVLRSVAAAVERGESVTVLGQNTQADLGDAVISSQEAADLLNVSRPFVVKLANSGQLAHHMVGNRHRFSLADVLAHAEHMRTERSQALAALAPAGAYTAEDF